MPSNEDYLAGDRGTFIWVCSRAVHYFKDFPYPLNHLLAPTFHHQSAFHAMYLKG